MTAKNAKKGRTGVSKKRAAEPAQPETIPMIEVPATKDSTSTEPTPVETAKVKTPIKKLSALDAAAQVLEDAGRPMACRELIEAMTARGLWTSPNGATPEATLYSAVLRELKARGDAARFVKAGRGLFAFRTQA
jgi:hypothetical protein